MNEDVLKSFLRKLVGRHLATSLQINLFTADLSILTISPCVTRFHCLPNSLMVGSSFLMVLQILSGFSLKFIIS